MPETNLPITLDATNLAPDVMPDHVKAWTNRLAWAQDFLDLFSEIEVERLEIEQLERDRLLVLIYLRVVTLAGGMPVNLTIGHLLQLRDGAIVSIDAFIDEQLAREFV